MDLKIYPEFEELIPPLTPDEFEGLESSILRNGYNKNYPVVHWNDIIIDGHHRYKICQKHNIEFTTEEMKFDSRSDVIIWMIDNQKNKRNANRITLTYLIGRQYLEQKLAANRPIGSTNENKLRQNDALKRTSEKIASQSNLGFRTVERAAVFASSLDSIVKNTGIKRQEILLGNIKAKQDDIKRLDNCKEVTGCNTTNCLRYTGKTEEDKKYRCDLIISKQRAIVNKVLQKEAKDIGDGIKAVEKEEKERTLRELAEKERIANEQAKREREERERLERERLRKEREERERVEKERLEKERLAREQARKEREEQERIKREQWEKEKAENERIRKEKAEKARLEQERLAKERAEKARLERERIEKERQELERQRIERLEKERIEKERIEKEKAEQKRLADAEAERKQSSCHFFVKYIKKTNYENTITNHIN